MENMKKKYETPRYEVVKFNADILTATSGCIPITISVERDPDDPNHCQAQYNPNGVWNNEYRPGFN